MDDLTSDRRPGAQRRWRTPRLRRRDRRGVLVGGSTRIPKVQRRQGAVRQGAAQGRQPRRGRGHGRRGPGRRARRRGQGPAAARRDAAVARHRDPGRRDDPDDPAQHDDPDAQERGVLDRVRQPDQRRGPRAAGRAPDGARQPDARPVPPEGHPAGAARRAADRGHVRHRRQRHPATSRRQGHGHGKDQKITITAPAGISRTTTIKMVREGRERTIGEDKKRREGDLVATGRQPLLPDEKIIDENRDKLDSADVSSMRESVAAAARRPRRATRTRSSGRWTSLEQATFAQWAEAMYGTGEAEAES